MSTKELIKAEIEKLDEEKLEELYDAIKKLTASNKPASEKPSFMAKLKRVKIDAPEDFSVNLDQYTVEKSGLNRLFIDTLFVVALINPWDQYHKSASKLAEKYEGFPLLTTDCVLLEIGNALARKFKTQAVEVIDDFIGSDEVEIIRLNSALFDKAYQLYRKYEDKEWGLIDK